MSQHGLILPVQSGQLTMILQIGWPGVALLATYACTPSDHSHTHTLNKDGTHDPPDTVIMYELLS